MTRVSIVFCGLVRDPEVLKLALATAVALRAQGKVHRLLLSTWHGEIERVPDGRALLRALDVQLLESAFPPALAVKGNVFQQMLSMDRALDDIDDDDLVLRTRTDIVFLDAAALEAVVTQDLALGPQLLDERGGRIFGGRIWVPYFHPLMPFYFADQLYFGRAADLRRLNNYDFLPEAYQITSRPHELHPGHSSGAAAEIRRFLKPFLEKFPVLREYTQVWPKHCVGTSLLCDVLAYNLASPLYRQYMALSLAMTYRYFRVGQIPAAADRVLVLGGGGDRLLQLRMSLAHDDPLPHAVAFRLRLPDPGSKLSAPSWSSAWLETLFAAPGRDPDAAAMVINPLAEVAAYRGDAARRQAFGAYRQRLWDIADAPSPAADRAPSDVGEAEIAPVAVDELR